MAESHAQLMQIRYDVPCRIKTVDGRALMVIKHQIPILGG
jgi:hypothetical protein